MGLFRKGMVTKSGPAWSSLRVPDSGITDSYRSELVSVWNSRKSIGRVRTSCLCSWKIEKHLSSTGREVLGGFKKSNSAMEK